MKRLALLLAVMFTMGLILLPCSVFALSFSNENGYPVDSTKPPLPALLPMTEEDFESKFEDNQPIDNPYFPMTDKTSTRIFESDDGEERFELTNIGKGRELMGVQTWTQRDRSYEEGLLVEDTFDYYAQDTDGNVWYMGEDVTNYVYDDGNLIETNDESAWLAENGESLPGWMMVANPQNNMGLNYYQEIAPDDEALDEGTIWALLDEVVLGNGEAFQNVLQILEHAPAFEEGEEAEWEYKYYAPNFGLIKVEEGLVNLDGDWVLGEEGLTFEYIGAAPVPEPGTIFLLGTGVVGLIGMGRKKMKK